MIVVLRLPNVRRVGWKFSCWKWWVSWEGSPNLSRRRYGKLPVNLRTQFGGRNRIYFLRKACHKCSIIIFKYKTSGSTKSIYEVPSASSSLSSKSTSTWSNSYFFETEATHTFIYLNVQLIFTPLHISLSILFFSAPKTNKKRSYRSECTGCRQLTVEAEQVGPQYPKKYHAYDLPVSESNYSMPFGNKYDK